MTELRLNLASDINRFHELACQRADEAIDHAKQAGLLLLEAKAALQHGEWLPWLEQNIFVSARQVQRYMQVAQGRALPIRSIRSPTTQDLPKNDSASHLNYALLPKKTGFAAIPNHYMITIHDGKLFCVEQSTTPGFFFVSCLELKAEDDVIVDFLTKPIRGDYVDWPLADFGMPDPAKVRWQWGEMEKPVASALERHEVAA